MRPVVDEPVADPVGEPEDEPAEPVAEPAVLPGVVAVLPPLAVPLGEVEVVPVVPVEDGAPLVLPAVPVVPVAFEPRRFSAVVPVPVVFPVLACEPPSSGTHGTAPGSCCGVPTPVVPVGVVVVP